MKAQIDVRKMLQSKMGDKANRIPAFLVNYLIRLVHQDELNDILNRYGEADGVEFMRLLVTDYFKVELNIIGEENIPTDDGKRYIFASNHPLGGFDGICLSYLLGSRYGGKIKCPVNDLLTYIPNLRSIFVPVNKHGKQNRATAAETDDAYASDNQILTFPAGLCSRKRHGVIRDLEWHKSFISKAIQHSRDVVPVYFEGRNSNFFYRLANIRRFFNIKFNLEMLFLPDELFKSKDKKFTVVVGQPIDYQIFKDGSKPTFHASKVMETVYNLVTTASFR
ncbi:MAG: glycerol acyltransferase [Tannerella sp.]|jgi:putative hemolysin|nr:glycerol acyltransferase [Tannerella sp.]